MAPKEEAGGSGSRCTVAAWTPIKNCAGRPPPVASTNCSKVGSGLLTTPGTTGSTPTLRVRSVLKPSTPTQELINPVPPKQSPGLISIIAQSSSVVAPLRDGNAACMLFSQADLRLPGTAPLSARSYHGKEGSESGRYTPTCGRANRTRPSAAATSTRESNIAWLPSPASGTFVPASPSSPPRLAALSPAALTRPITYVGNKNKPAGMNGKDIAPSGCGVGADTNCSGTPAAAARESRGIDQGRLAKTRRHPLNSMSPLEKPRVRETGYMANYRLAQGEGQQPRNSLESKLVQNGQTDPPQANHLEDKTRSIESIKSGAHTGMSVAEFADKVAALAAEVAKVFGRKQVSQSPNCRKYGLE